VKKVVVLDREEGGARDEEGREARRGQMAWNMQRGNRREDRGRDSEESGE
jgi:hypothetical protein